MLRYFFTCSLIFLSSSIYCQDSLSVQDTVYYEPQALINEIGFGPMMMIPAGIYKTHDSRVQPGLALTYFRQIGDLSSSLSQYLGLEVNWIDLGTASNDITEFGPDGEFEYTSIADIEYVSLILNYRLQPDLAFFVWPYVEIGIGPAIMYTNDRERYDVDGETEENIELLKSDCTISKRFGFGVQYVFSNINSYLDLSWRFSFHNKVEYNTIDKEDILPDTRPAEFLNERVSRVSNQLVKVSFNYMF